MHKGDEVSMRVMQCLRQSQEGPCSHAVCVMDMSEAHRKALGDSLCQFLVGVFIDGTHQQLILHVLPHFGFRVVCMHTHSV